MKKGLSLNDRLIAVIDVSRQSELMSMLTALGGRVSTVKLGLEMIYSVGAKVADIASRSGYRVMLDTKLMDIPNTVKGASAAISGLKPSIITLYALGGKKMIEASLEALEERSASEGITRPLVLAVTVLTSLDDSDLAGMGFAGGHMETVKRLAGTALEAGADGIVCAPGEARLLKQEFGDDFYIATPGIRLEGDSSGDQKRINTPEQAIASGADMLIVGRSITGKKDVGKAAGLFLEKIEKSLKENTR